MPYQTLNDIISEVASSIRPPERITISDAAERYRYLNNPGSYVGPWRNAVAPYMVEPTNVLTSREYQASIFVGPAQSAKTEQILNWIVYGIACEPADFLLYQTSQTIARDFSKRRVDRVFRNTPIARAALIRRRDADNTYDKYFRDGTILTLSWPSIAELSGRPVGRVALTDYDRMPENVEGEGAPFDLARKRTTTFGSFAMTLAESSPGYACEDAKWKPNPARPHEAPPCKGILALYNRGDRRRFFWQCPHCSDWFEPAFRLLKWVASADHLECGESAQMVCPKCAALIPHTAKSELNQGGRWLREGEKLSRKGKLSGKAVRSDIASWWLKGPAAAFATWHTLVVNWLKATEEYERTGSQEALKSTVNTDQGEPYTYIGTGTTRDADALAARATPMGEQVVPAAVRFLVATVDIQNSCFVVQVHGLALDRDIYVIDRFTIKKSARRDKDDERYPVNPGAYLEDWDLITEQVIRRSYPLGEGSTRRMQIKYVGCDSGGEAGVTKNAYDWFRRLRKLGLQSRVRLIKGASNKNAPMVRLEYPESERKDRKAAARGEIPVLMINTDVLKDAIDHALNKVDPGGGFIHLPKWLPEWFYQELCAEVRTPKGWEKVGKRNEAFDLLVYTLAIVSYAEAQKHLNWSNPPNWAAEWDENALVIDGEAEATAEEPPSEKAELNTLAELGKLLG